MDRLYGNQRYYALHRYYKNTFGRKIHKAVIDGGFTCPNKDGTLSHQGCLFCLKGSGYFTGRGTITEQLAAEKKRIFAKEPNAGIIAYFQANTNTYAPVSVLKSRFEEALADKDVVGISIGTRADCLPDETIKYLCELSERNWLTVEIGLQTVHEDTADRMNLCCSRTLIKEQVVKLKKYGIRVCLHIINGLPYETHEQMIETVREAASWKPDAVKIQLLHVIEGTPLAEMYKDKPFPILEEDEYVRLVVQQLEYLPPFTVCERLTGDGDGSKLIAPLWSIRKMHILNKIAQLQKLRDTFQGKKYIP